MKVISLLLKKGVAESNIIFLNLVAVSEFDLFSLPFCFDCIVIKKL